MVVQCVSHNSLQEDVEEGGGEHTALSYTDGGSEPVPYAVVKVDCAGGQQDSLFMVGDCVQTTVDTKPNRPSTTESPQITNFLDSTIDKKPASHVEFKRLTFMCQFCNKLSPTSLRYASELRHMCLATVEEMHSVRFSDHMRRSTGKTLTVNKAKGNKSISIWLNAFINVCP